MEKVLSLNLRLKQAIEWLKSNKGMRNLDIAKRMGIAEASFSRGLKRCEERVDSNFVIKFYQATGEIFSLDWLLNGTGDKFASEEKPQEQEPQAPGNLDFSTYINALLAKTDETIASMKRELATKDEAMKRELATKDEAMKRELAAKDEIIQAKDDRIADLEKLADERLHRIAELRRIIDSTGIDIHGFPFPVGTAEGKKKQAKHP
jgi:hypothetical protein